MKVSVFDIDGTLSPGFFIVEFPKWLCATKPDAFDPVENRVIQELYRTHSTHEPYEGKELNSQTQAFGIIGA